jgi:hypothetical protein
MAIVYHYIVVSIVVAVQGCSCPTANSQAAKIAWLGNLPLQLSAADAKAILVARQFEVTDLRLTVGQRSVLRSHGIPEQEWNHHKIVGRRIVGHCGPLVAKVVVATVKLDEDDNRVETIDVAESFEGP